MFSALKYAYTSILKIIFNYFDFLASEVEKLTLFQMINIGLYEIEFDWRWQNRTDQFS